MIKSITVPKDKYYKMILTIINCFIGLTDYELNIITQMLINDIKVLNTATRVIVREKLQTNVASFNNYIKRLKDRKALVETKDGLVISDGIMDALEDHKIDITFNVT